MSDAYEAFIADKLDDIYEACDTLMKTDNIALLDFLCEKWDIEDVTLTIGVLSATLPVKDKLPERDKLLQRAKEKFGDDGELWRGL
jgi:hypothetical protein